MTNKPKQGSNNKFSSLAFSTFCLADLLLEKEILKVNPNAFLVEW